MTSALKWIYWLRWILCLPALAIVLSGCTPEKRKTPTAKVERGDVEVTVTLSGAVKPFRSTVLAAPYTGYLRKLYVKVGDRVKQGDPLIGFSANLSNQEQIFPIRAAYPGLISQVLKLDGDYISSTGTDSKILKLEDTSSLYIESEVPEADIAKIKQQQKAVIRINALPEQTFEGDIVQIFLSARDTENSWERKGGTFPVRIKIKNPTDELKTGLSAIVEIVVNSRPNVLRLPQEYVLREHGKSYVVLAKNNQRQEVELGLRSDFHVEIIKGLNEGEEVLFPMSESEE